MSPGRANTHDSLWQAARWLPGLAADSFRPDDRSPEELAQWVERFAGILTYFDDANVPQPPSEEPGEPGPWAGFFRSDVTFLLAGICTHDPEAQYREALNTGAFTSLIEVSVARLIDWRRQAQRLAVLTPPESVERALDGVLRSASKNELSQALPRHFSPAQLTEATPSDVSEWFAGGAGSDESTLRLLCRVEGQIAERARPLFQRSLTHKSDHASHSGLMLAFVDLFTRAQSDLNGLTERHLSFYYEKVLGLAPEGALPDSADIVAELAPDLAEAKLPRGSRLLAGSGSVAHPVYFETDHDLAVMPGRLVAHRALAVERRPQPGGGGPVTAIRAYPVVNSADGFGAPLPKGMRAWRGFGPAMPDRSANAEIGIVLTSPVLRMSGGVRRVIVTLTFAESRDWTLARALATLDARIRSSDGEVPEKLRARYLALGLDCKFSTDEGMVQAGDVTADLADVEAGRLRLMLDLPPTAPAIIGSRQGGDPQLTIALAPDAPVYVLSVFEQAVIASVRLDVQVSQFRNLLASGPTGPVDLSKPFFPFGPMPAPGGALLLSAPELSHSGLRQLTVSMTWTGLPAPPETIAAHYAGYGADITAARFRVTFAQSDGRVWHPLHAATGDPADDLALFQRLPGPEQRLSSRTVLQGDTAARPGDTPDAGSSAQRHPGALRIALTSPEAGFGHVIYPVAVTNAALERAAARSRRAAAKIVPPKPPLNPQVSDLSVSYEARDSIDRIGHEKSMTLGYLNPLGQPTPNRSGRFLQDDYSFDGFLMLGFEGLRPPSELTLLFDIDATTSAPWSRRDRFAYPAYAWCYFDGETWLALAESDVISDSTRGLTRRGILRIALPHDLRPGARYPGGLRWLGIRVEGDISRYGGLRAILSNAVRATRIIDGSEPAADGVAPQLKPGTISRLSEPVAGIKAVRQPFATSGGRAPESRRQFQLRVSERLSHKARAILPRDYTRMILEAFPDIGQATCLRTGSGRVDIVVSPRRAAPLSPTQAPPLVPMWMRLEISRWLAERIGMSAHHVLVRNPGYESLRVAARIVPLDGQSAGLLRRVDQAIRDHIAPWLARPDQPMPVAAAQLETAALFACVQRVDGVRYVHGFSVVQLYRHEAFRGDRFGLKDSARTPIRTLQSQNTTLRGGGSGSVFVPAARNALSFVPHRTGIGSLTVGRDLFPVSGDEAAAFETDPGRIPCAPQSFGIGQMRVGTDMVMSDPADAGAPVSTGKPGADAFDTLSLAFKEVD